VRLQAIILAAGMGRRLGELTRSRAKCMVQVCGKTLIERQLNSLSELGIKKAVIVVGYEADGIRNLIGNEFKGMEIIYVFNEKYAITNNIYSLWLARNYLIQEDTILLESDIIFDKSLLSRIVSSEHDNVVAVAKYEPWMDGTVTLVDEKDKVIAFVNKTGFRWEYVNNYFKTINIYKFSSEFSRKAYLPFLNAYI
jgi:choline kinase